MIFGIKVPKHFQSFENLDNNMQNDNKYLYPNKP